MGRFPYLPHTEADIQAMLKRIGCGSIEELFSSIPDSMRHKGPLPLPEPMSEWELNEQMERLCAANPPRSTRYYIGAGSYDHYIPAIVRSLASRSEFVTAYTPYQPEASQGTLQAIYEFQTMITELTDMDVATASHYDGATALAEALLIPLRKKSSKGEGKVAVSRLIHPAHRQIIRTYLQPVGYTVVDIPADNNGKTDLTRASEIIPRDQGEFAAVVIQSPNFFGYIEDLADARALCDACQIMFIASFTEALSLGILKPPGSFGADLVAGEGQSLGLTRSFGGPGLGLLAGTGKQMRNLPGRLVGKTVDKDGERGYVLTLATREQHIRREKASSNICSNNGLNALTAAIYLASAGKEGIRSLAQQNHDKASYLKRKLGEAGFCFPFQSPFFNEFVCHAPARFRKIREKLMAEENIHAGLPLEDYYPELSDHYLFCATETAKKTEMDALAWRCRYGTE